MITVIVSGFLDSVTCGDNLLHENDIGGADHTATDDLLITATNDIVDSDSNDIIIDPVLSYIVLGSISGTSENVHRTVVSNLAADQIYKAKYKLWHVCDPNLQG